MSKKYSFVSFINQRESFSVFIKQRKEFTLGVQDFSQINNRFLSSVLFNINPISITGDIILINNLAKLNLYDGKSLNTFSGCSLADMDYGIGM